MSCEISKQCVGCPKIAPYVNGIEKAEANRGQILSDAEHFMQGGTPQDELEEFLEDHEAILSATEVTSSKSGAKNAAGILSRLIEIADQSDSNVRSRTEDALQACDDVTDSCKKMIEMFTKNCNGGPKMRRKYILFGHKVLKCSSVSLARIVPQRFLS